MASQPQGARIGGIPVRVHWSVFFVLALFTDALAATVLPAAAAGYPTAAYWGAAAACAVVFMLCLLAHELSHALVAKRVGLRVRRITLWLLGGVTQLDGQAPTARSDLAIAVAGPAVSVGCSVVFWGAALAAAGSGAGPLMVAALLWLGWANTIVAVFNLLPGAPLDGGRVLRALLWWRGGNRQRAAVTATRAGGVLGMVLVAAGVLLVFAGAFSGLWLVLLGVFLGTAAKAEQNAERLSNLTLTAAEAMTPDPVCAPGWYTLAAFLDWVGEHGAQRGYPVLDFEGRLMGIVVLDDLARVSRPPTSLRVLDVTRPLDRVMVLRPDEPVAKLLIGVGQRGGAQAGAPALVIEDGRLLGTIDADRLTRAIQLASLRQSVARS
jgi:Zn-dependent protease